MLFNSYEFLIFLPLTFICYWFIFRKFSLQNIFIVFASYIFYGWWDWRFLYLILFTTILCYCTGALIGKSGKRRISQWLCGINIGVNIAILCFFKYFNFFSESLKLLFSQFGYELDWFTLDVLLPVGISFYTFQAISYPIDVYRGNIKATRDFVAFTAFISFFPQLVAGPIERSTQLLPQFLKKRVFDYNRALDGMRQILWVFFKKIVIADNCASLANNIFENYQYCNATTLWLGAFFFTFQIYGDFSGYSDIAIGTARLFGISLSRNFHFPYFSRDIAEFWRRWHISLNTWFRDYIYIPLGGSRCSQIKVIRNILIIFLLSGLWHGANWTFVIWGVYHGLLFLPLILLKKNRKNLEIVAHERHFPKFSECISIFITFFLVVVGWIIFRSETINDAFNYIYLCFTSFKPGINPISGNFTSFVFTIPMIILLQIIDWSQRHKSYGLQIVEGQPLLLRWSIYIVLCFIILIFSGIQAQFIYFQF